MNECCKIGTYECCVSLKLPFKQNFFGTEREYVSVDKCIVDEIKDLWSKGIKTTGCCCGHNTIDGYVGVVDEDIPKMKQLGYRVQFNPHRPNYEDTFYLKTNLKKG